MNAHATKKTPMTSSKKSKLAEGFELPVPTRVPVSEDAARRFEQGEAPVQAPAPAPAVAPTLAPSAAPAAKKEPLAVGRLTLRVHPDTAKAVEAYGYENRLTQKRVIVEGLKALGVKVAPSDLG